MQTAGHQGARLGRLFCGTTIGRCRLDRSKKAEDDNALILRFYEWAAEQSDVKAKLPPGAQGAQEADLMERTNRGPVVCV